MAYHFSTLPAGQRSELPAAQRAEEKPTVLLVLFSALMITHLLQLGYRIPTLGTLRFEFILGILALLASIPHFENFKGTGASRVVGATLALTFVFIINVPLSVDPWHSWELFIDKVLKFALLAIITAAAASVTFGPRIFLFVYLIPFLKMAQEGITGIITGNMIWENQGIPRLHGSTPMYHHPNSFAGTQLGTLPFLQSAFQLSGKGIQIAVIGQCIAAVLVVIYCGSRTSYVSLGIFLLYAIIRSQSKFKVAIAIATILFAAYTYSPQAYIDRLSTLVTGTEIEGGSMDARKVILEDALAIFSENPMGVGVDAFRTVRVSKFGRKQDTHNLYLQIATDLGVPGLLAFGLFIASLFKTLSRIHYRTVDTIRIFEGNNHTSSDGHKLLREANSVLILTSGIKGFLVIRLALGLFGHDLYENYWWIVAGLTIGLCKRLSKLELAASVSQHIPSAHPDALSRISSGNPNSVKI